MMKKMTVRDATAVRDRKISSGIFFGRDMANEQTFLLYWKIENETKTGQISEGEISDPYF